MDHRDTPFNRDRRHSFDNRLPESVPESDMTRQSQWSAAAPLPVQTELGGWHNPGAFILGDPSGYWQGQV